VLTDNDGGADVARQLQALDIEVAELVDTRTGAVVVEALGRSRLRAVRVAQTDTTAAAIHQHRSPGGGFAHSIQPASIREIACDLLCISSRLEPANELLLQAGMRFQHQDGHWLPANDVPGVTASGTVAGQGGSETCPGTFSILPQLDGGHNKRFVCLC